MDMEVTMRNIINTLLLVATILNPMMAHAKSDDTRRVECLFSFGIAKESCKRGFGKDYNKTIEELWKDAVDFSDKGGKIKSLIVDLGVPNQIAFTFQFSGNGVTVIYNGAEKVHRITKLVKEGKFDAEIDIFDEILPDQLRITVGIELALILTIRAETILIYTEKDEIDHALNVLEGM